MKSGFHQRRGGSRDYAWHVFLILCASLCLPSQAIPQHLAWTKCADLPFTTIMGIHASPAGDIFVWSDSALCVSTDNGTTWQPRPVRGTRIYSLAVDSAGHVYAAMGDSMYVSLTADSDWIPRGKLPGNIYGGYTMKIHRNGFIFFDGGIGSLYRSTNGGGTFSTVIQGSSLFSHLTTFDISPWGYVYAAQATRYSTEGNVYFSTNNGNSWSVSILSFSNPFPSLSAGNPGLVITGTSFESYHGASYLSTDFGATWTPLTTPWSASAFSASCIDRDGHVIVGTSRGASPYVDGVFVSTDRGVTWTEENAGLPSTRIKELSLSSRGYLFTCFPQDSYERIPGLYRTVSLTTGVPGSGETPPATFSLRQNFPNPFNPETIIGFQLASPSATRIAIYDILGREVAILVDGMKNPGSYDVRWTAAGCATGTYICRMVAGSFVTSTKMLYAQ
jgi:hypothetical protein